MPVEPSNGHGLILGRATLTFDGFEGKHEQYMGRLVVRLSSQAKIDESSSRHEIEVVAHPDGYFALAGLPPDRYYRVDSIEGANFKAEIPFQISTPIRSGDSHRGDVLDIGSFALTVDTQGSIGCEASSPSASISKKPGGANGTIISSSAAPLDRHLWFERQYPDSGWASKVATDRQRIEREREDGQKKSSKPEEDKQAPPSPPTAPPEERLRFAETPDSTPESGTAGSVKPATPTEVVQPEKKSSKPEEGKQAPPSPPTAPPEERLRFAETPDSTSKSVGEGSVTSATSTEVVQPSSTSQTPLSSGPDQKPTGTILHELWTAQLANQTPALLTRVKLTPDRDHLLVFFNTSSSVARVNKLEARTGQVVWSKSVKLHGRVTDNGWVDRQGNIYLCSTIGGHTLWKFDPEMERELWRYTGKDGFEYVVAIMTDAEGNVYASGFSGSSSNQGSTCVKLTPDGDLVWKCNSRYTGGKDAYAEAIALDPQGNLYRVGADCPGNGDESKNVGRMIRHSSDDGIEKLNIPMEESNSSASGLLTDNDGSFYIGYTRNAWTGSGARPFNTEVLVKKFDFQGTGLWKYKFEGEGIFLGRDALMRRSDRSFYVAFQRNVNGNMYPGFAEIDRDGKLIWAETLDRPGWDLSWARADAHDSLLYVGLNKVGDNRQFQVVAVRVGDVTSAAEAK